MRYYDPYKPSSVIMLLARTYILCVCIELSVLNTFLCLCIDVNLTLG